MSKDLAEMEREFVEALAGDTGRSLGAWMDAISSSGNDNRNAIIDWLRQQGFAFPKASWLERIHHNGGKLIYADDSPIALMIPRTPAPLRPASGTKRGPTMKDTPAQENPLLTPQREDSASSNPAFARSSHQVPGLMPANAEELNKLLALAKGLRPLAELVLREIETVVPGTRHVIVPPYLIFASPAQFAALLAQPKEIRLYADFGAKSRDRTRKAEAARGAPPYPDVMILNDARQIDERFREIVAEAYGRALN